MGGSPGPIAGPITSSPGNGEGTVVFDSDSDSVGVACPLVFSSLEAPLPIPLDFIEGVAVWRL